VQQAILNITRISRGDYNFYSDDSELKSQLCHSFCS
jgi:hypothetical protein